MQKTCRFLFLFLIRQSLGWICRGVFIDDDKQCKCGSDLLTKEKDEYDYEYGYDYDYDENGT